MTGGAANKETKYSLNILIRYDWKQLIKIQNIVSISSSDMTGRATNKEIKYSLITSSDMTGGASNKEIKYSLNILIRYDWRSS